VKTPELLLNVSPPLNAEPGADRGPQAGSPLGVVDADRGPQAGSPLGVVDATGSRRIAQGVRFLNKIKISLSWADLPVS